MNLKPNDYYAKYLRNKYFIFYAMEVVQMQPLPANEAFLQFWEIKAGFRVRIGY